MTDEQYRLRLENWIRWARGRKYGPAGARCQGIESLWRSMNWGDIAEGPESMLQALHGPVMILDAIRVEDAWKTLPERPRGFLKYALVKAENPRKTCRRYQLHWLAYDGELMQSAAQLRKACEDARIVVRSD